MDTPKSTNFIMVVDILFKILLLVGFVYGAGPVYDVDRAPALYSRYIQEYNKTYPDLQDLLIHYESFKQQLIKINTYNTVTSSSADINLYTDYTDDEKAKLIAEKQRKYQEKLASRRYLSAKTIIDFIVPINQSTY